MEKWEALQTGSHFGSSLRPEHRVEHECLFVPNLIPNDCELLILLAQNTERAVSWLQIAHVCDIIELYGRVPRAKTNQQMLTELDRLYELGYRGHVDFVDDNLIGNKKAVKGFLPTSRAGTRTTITRSNSRQKLRSICPMIRS